MAVLFAAPLVAQEPQAEPAGETRTLRVATREVPPFAMRDEDGGWRGLSIELAEEVRRDLEKDSGELITLEYVDLGLEEMLDAVEAGEVDLAAAALTVNFERERRLDFSHPFYRSGLGIAVNGEDEPIGLFAFARSVLSPTFLKIVAGLVATMLATGVALYFFERRVNREQFGGGAVRGVASGLWWSAVTLTTVGYGDKVPKSAAGRAIGMLWMFSGLFIIASFTAAVTSALTVSELRARINGPADLARARVATVADSTSAEYLTSRRVFPRKFGDVGAALESLDAGRCDAVVYDAPVLRWQVNQDFADRLMVLPAEFQRQDYAFALPPKSPLRESVNRSLLRATSGVEWEETLANYFGGESL